MNNKFFAYVVPMFALAGLSTGVIFYLLKYEQYSNQTWMITLIIGIIPLIYRMSKDIFRGHFGIDLIAIVAIVTSFILQQYLAGVVILLMLSGGEALEAYALKRSSRELTKLLSLAPTIGHLKSGDRLLDIPADEIKAGDVLLIKPGETLPVDGLVITGTSEIDESSITGESILMQKTPGSLVFSGSINKDAALEISASKAAADSQYQRIVKLIKEAQENRSPMVRLADRYAVWFTALTFILSVGAWIISGESLRFLAVLVVATPCPLILATPIAIISGISKAASRGIIIKNGGALEKLGEAKAIVFDKTGTLTLGEPKVLEIISSNQYTSKEQILNISASLDQLSVHALGRALVHFAKQKNDNALIIPTNLKESLGNGVSGEILGKNYIFGKLSYLKQNGVTVPEKDETEHKQFQQQGKIAVYLAEDKQFLGVVIFADILRPEIEQVFTEIIKHKIQKVFMLTGDKTPVAKKIADELGIINFKAEMLPEDKVKEVLKIKQQFSPVAMVGDGVNDAPSLAAADVGIALAAHGSSAASESADVVIMQNNLMRVHDAVHIAQSVMRIAKQSIFAGLGLSIILMLLAAFGYIEPVYGALLQEAIDVAVILNALRVNFEQVN
jgi:heavy metal translocating P-type ATPase